MVSQGDIIRIDFEPVSGHEQGKKRPAVVVSNNDYNRQTQLAMVVPISHAKDFPMHIDLPKGLKTDGKVLCEHARSMDIEARGYEYLESLPEDFLERILKICKWCF